MAVIAIVGSPRAGGNSETIVDAILAGAKENGKEVKKYNLNKMKIIGCQACMGCKKDGVCVQKDDMKQVLEDVKAAEAVVLATPIYFGQPSAQLRMFQDRCYSFMAMDFKPFIAPGKKLITVATAGSGAGAQATADALEGVYKNYFGMTPVDKIVFSGGGPPNAAAGDKAVLDKAKAAGKKL